MGDRAIRDAASSRADLEPLGGVVIDRPPLPLAQAVRSLASCAVHAATLSVRGRIRQPKDHLGDVLGFADGSHGCVYRETTRIAAAVDAPAVLVVGFRLRWIRGRGHALFRVESLLNTPLFVGFPGFVSKLWLAHDRHGLYRGIYEWNDAQLADRYARALWWVLTVACVPRTVHYVVLPGLRRDDLLADPTRLDQRARDEPHAWWRVTTVQHNVSTSLQEQAMTHSPALPPDVELVRTTPTFDERTIPAGLLRAHRIGEGMWGRLVVVSGGLAVRFEDGADDATRLGAGASVVIPPGRPHHVELDGPVSFAIEFHSRPAGGQTGAHS